MLGSGDDVRLGTATRSRLWRKSFSVRGGVMRDPGGGQGVMGDMLSLLGTDPQALNRQAELGGSRFHL